MTERPLPELVELWLNDEYAHSRLKFGVTQAEKLKTKDLLSGENFAGQAQSYWDRMHNYDIDASLHLAQYAGKTANAARMLWATIRSFEWEDNRFAVLHASGLIREQLESSSDWRNAKAYKEEDDFYATPIGLGLGYLARQLREHDISDRRFRLGQLIRAEDIMYDAAGLMAVQFEETLSTTGTLPKPGLSSGNVEPWI